MGKGSLGWGGGHAPKTASELQIGGRFLSSLSQVFFQIAKPYFKAPLLVRGSQTGAERVVAAVSPVALSHLPR